MFESGTGNGANLVLHDSTGVANERFSFSYAGNGYFWITNNNSARYIATPGTEKENGTRVFQWQFYNNPNFQWKFIPVKDATGAKSIKSGLEEHVTIYPNPTKGNLSIIKSSNNNLLVNVFTMEGKHYMQQELTSELTELSLPGSMQSGMYLFAFSDADKNESFVKKILVELAL